MRKNRQPKVVVELAGISKISESGKRKRLAILSLIAEELAEKLRPAMDNNITSEECFDHYLLIEIIRKQWLGIIPRVERKCFLYFGFFEKSMQIFYCSFDVRYEVEFPELRGKILQALSLIAEKHGINKIKFSIHDTSFGNTIN